MAKTLKGKNLMLSIGGVIYGFATSCDISIDVDTKEISSGSYKHSTSAGQWKEYETERTGWSLNSAHLCASDLADQKTLFAAMTAGKPVEVAFEQVTLSSSLTDKLAGETGTLVDGAAGFYGSAIITSMKLSGSMDGDATFDVSLTGNGELSTTKPVA